MPSGAKPFMYMLSVTTLQGRSNYSHFADEEINSVKSNNLPKVTQLKSAKERKSDNWQWL